MLQGGGCAHFSYLDTPAAPNPKAGLSISFYVSAPPPHWKTPHPLCLHNLTSDHTLTLVSAFWKLLSHPTRAAPQIGLISHRTPLSRWCLAPHPLLLPPKDSLISHSGCGLRFEYPSLSSPPWGIVLILQSPSAWLLLPCSLFQSPFFFRESGQSWKNKRTHFCGT